MAAPTAEAPAVAPEPDIDGPDHPAAGLDTPAEAPLAVKIAHAMAEAGQVTKSSVNTDQGYKFASAEAILAAVRGPLLRRGVILLPTVEDLVEHEITSSRGSKGTRVVLNVTFTFTDGADTLVRSWRGEGQDYGDKAYGKAYTNAVKTFVRSAWLLPTEHDDPEGSPAGDRVAAAEIPPWARPLNTDDLKRGFMQALTRVVNALGGDNDQAKVLAKTWSEAFGGGIPYGVSGVIGAIANELVPERPAEDPAAAAEAAAAAAAERDVAAQAAAGEEPQAPHQAGTNGDSAAEPASGDPDPRPVPTSNAPPPDGYDRWPTAEDFLERWSNARKQAGQPAGLKDATDTLRAAGCTCPDPLGLRGPAKTADTCPFLDHGVPF